MGDPTLTTDLGRVLVTGGSGFVGTNLVTELLDRGHAVRSFDRVPSPLSPRDGLQTAVGDITAATDVARAVEGIDTVIHTAAVIDLMGGGSAPARERSFAVNVGGTQTLVRAAQAAGVKRFVYTASNSVVMGGQRITGGDETLPYTARFADLYTETKVAAEKFVLSENSADGTGMLTCSIRPSGIWGRGDQTMFRKLFESVLAGHVKVLVGSKDVKLDNSYVHNLIHGFLLAGEHLVPGGSAPGQAYFINDGEPINMFEFSRPVIEACGHRWPRLRISGRFVHVVMSAWQWLHFRFGLPQPPLEPLAVERVYLDNYFSTAKAERDLGYRPLYTTEAAMADCLPYYTKLYAEMKAVASPVPAPA
ncbi:steroid Delta-isomerase [Mycobacterium antarcticum]|uniref:3-beta-hydroxysteroid dehydrogenase n=1 Tax=unclassified Mycolicibacterium TaxID=2636767 RepID=UPI0023859A11|nr:MULTISPECIES: NAD-dependent epimerase/dehydratase family protein [unclassified Mycolicibacterium]BDX30706.1 steroid Delta-isomerase [Mycolicibacterium sp. TUM20985]GLP79854.1 steroid Delta-isomerase [Mycolicibacterium sp. TUM20984]